MKAVLLKKINGPLQVETIAIPKPKLGQVLIKMEASAIHPADFSYIKGKLGFSRKLPVIPGFEGCGVVVKSGDGLLGWSLIGQKVSLDMTSTPPGTWAEYLVIDVVRCIPLDKQTSIESGAFALGNPMTALAFLDIATTENCNSIILSAACSTVARMTSKYLGIKGVKVVNIVRKKVQMRILRSDGARHILNSSDVDFVQNLKKMINMMHPTIFFDAVGGGLTGVVLKHMPEKSVCYIYGMLGKEKCEIDGRDLRMKEKSIQGFCLRDWMKGKGMVQILKMFNELKKNQCFFKTKISKIISIEDISEGIQFYKDNMTLGKVLINLSTKRNENLKEIDVCCSERYKNYSESNDEDISADNKKVISFGKGGNYKEWEFPRKNEKFDKHKRNKTSDNAIELMGNSMDFGNNEDIYRGDIIIIEKNQVNEEENIGKLEENEESNIINEKRTKHTQKITRSKMKNILKTEEFTEKFDFNGEIEKNIESEDGQYGDIIEKSQVNYGENSGKYDDNSEENNIINEKGIKHVENVKRSRIENSMKNEKIEEISQNLPYNEKTHIILMKIEEIIEIIEENEEIIKISTKNQPNLDSFKHEKRLFSGDEKEEIDVICVKCLEIIEKSENLTEKLQGMMYNAEKENRINIEKYKQNTGNKLESIVDEIEDIISLHEKILKKKEIYERTQKILDICKEILELLKMNFGNFIKNMKIVEKIDNLLKNLKNKNLLKQNEDFDMKNDNDNNEILQKTEEILEIIEKREEIIEIYRKSLEISTKNNKNEGKNVKIDENDNKKLEYLQFFAHIQDFQEKLKENQGLFKINEKALKIIEKSEGFLEKYQNFVQNDNKNTDKTQKVIINTKKHLNLINDKNIESCYQIIIEEFGKIIEINEEIIEKNENSENENILEKSKKIIEKSEEIMEIIKNLFQKEGKTSQRTDKATKILKRFEEIMIILKENEEIMTKNEELMGKNSQILSENKKIHDNNKEISKILQIPSKNTNRIEKIDELVDLFENNKEELNEVSKKAVEIIEISYNMFEKLEEIQEKNINKVKIKEFKAKKLCNITKYLKEIESNEVIIEMINEEIEDIIEINQKIIENSEIITIEKITMEEKCKEIIRKSQEILEIIHKFNENDEILEKNEEIIMKTENNTEKSEIFHENEKNPVILDKIEEILGIIEESELIITKNEEYIEKGKNHKKVLSKKNENIDKSDQNIKILEKNEKIAEYVQNNDKILHVNNAEYIEFHLESLKTEEILKINEKNSIIIEKSQNIIDKIDEMTGENKGILINNEKYLENNEKNLSFYEENLKNIDNKEELIKIIQGIERINQLNKEILVKSEGIMNEKEKIIEKSKEIIEKCEEIIEIIKKPYEKQTFIEDLDVNNELEEENIEQIKENMKINEEYIQNHKKNDKTNGISLLNDEFYKENDLKDLVKSENNPIKNNDEASTITNIEENEIYEGKLDKTKEKVEIKENFIKRNENIEKIENINENAKKLQENDELFNDKEIEVGLLKNEEYFGKSEEIIDFNAKNKENTVEINKENEGIFHNIQQIVQYTETNILLKNEEIFELLVKTEKMIKINIDFHEVIINSLEITEKSQNLLKEIEEILKNTEISHFNEKTIKKHKKMKKSSEINQLDIITDELQDIIDIHEKIIAKSEGILLKKEEIIEKSKQILEKTHEIFKEINKRNLENPINFNKKDEILEENRKNVEITEKIIENEDKFNELLMNIGEILAMIEKSENIIKKNEEDISKNNQIFLTEDENNRKNAENNQNNDKNLELAANIERMIEKKGEINENPEQFYEFCEKNMKIILEKSQKIKEKIENISEIQQNYENFISENLNENKGKIKRNTNKSSKLRENLWEILDNINEEIEELIEINEEVIEKSNGIFLDKKEMIEISKQIIAKSEKMLQINHLILDKLQRKQRKREKIEKSKNEENEENTSKIEENNNENEKLIENKEKIDIIAKNEEIPGKIDENSEKIDKINFDEKKGIFEINTKDIIEKKIDIINNANENEEFSEKPQQQSKLKINITEKPVKKIELNETLFESEEILQYNQELIRKNVENNEIISPAIKDNELKETQEDPAKKSSENASENKTIDEQKNENLPEKQENPLDKYKKSKFLFPKYERISKKTEESIDFPERNYENSEKPMDNSMELMRTSEDNMQKVSQMNIKSTCSILSPLNLRSPPKSPTKIFHGPMHLRNSLNVFTNNKSATLLKSPLNLKSSSNLGSPFNKRGEKDSPSNSKSPTKNPNRYAILGLYGMINSPSNKELEELDGAKFKSIFAEIKKEQL